MTRVNANGYDDSEDNEEARYEKRKAMCAQRIEDYKSGSYAHGGALPDEAPAGAPQFLVDYIDCYRTKRGYHPRSQGDEHGWNVTGCQSFLNMPLLQYSNEIRSAVPMIHGENAHSCYFSRDAYADMLNGNNDTDNKELLILPGAVHTDLYDGGGKNAIPFDKLEQFFAVNFK